MAVPKKRKSKTKKSITRFFWKKKGLIKASQAYQKFYKDKEVFRGSNLSDPLGQNRSNLDISDDVSQ